MIVMRAQPATRALLAIQPVTSLASLIRSTVRMESSLRSGNFPTLAALAGQINNNSSSNRCGSNKNNNSAPSYSEQHAVASVDSPSELAYAASQPDSSQLDYAHSLAPLHTLPPSSPCITSHLLGKDFD